MAIREYESTPQEVRSFALFQLAITAAFLLLIFWALDGLDADVPPWWLFVILLVPVPIAAYFAEQVWLNAAPLDPEETPEENQRLAVSTYTAHTVRRLWICLTPITIAVLTSFFATYAAWPVVIGGIPGLVVLAFELWPSLRNLSMTAAVLETEGASSGLVESFRTR